jgi:heat shock transcription factor, other eukaryote
MPQPYNTGNVTGDQVVRWNGVGDNVGSFLEGADGAGSSYELVQSQSQFSPLPSDALTRRPMNRALVPANSRPAFDTAGPWPSFMGDDTSLITRDGDNETAEQDNIEKLEEMAQKAKRDAQGKRKQIPPFVQKLSR